MNVIGRIIYRAGNLAYILSVSLLIAALLVNAIPPGPAYAEAGSIWTTLGDCNDPNAQNENQYVTYQTVHIRGSGFDPDSDVTWELTKPGDQTEPPFFYSGTGETDENGYFCVFAHTILPGEDGTYKYSVMVGGSEKHDNYTVNELQFSITLNKTGVLDLGNDYLDVGDMINYDLVVANNGNGTLTNISVSDPLLGAITCPVGNPIPSLSAGANVTCSGSYAITQADIDAGHRDNTATADSDQAGPVTDGFNVLLIPSPEISLNKTGVLVLGNGSLDVGDLINYSLEVVNIGNSTLTNITVSDPLLGTITCPPGNPIPSLAPGARQTCTGSYAVTQADLDAGIRHNTATASSGQASATDSYDVPLDATPALSIQKTGALDLGNGSLEPGDLINYYLLVTNAGNKTLTNITVSDPLLGTITCPLGNPIPTLAPGASQNCTGSYAITQEDIDAGHRANTATASDGQITVTDDFDVTLEASPAISLTKTGVLVLGNGLLEVGDLINYNLVVTNTGNGTLTNISVSDPLLGTITCPDGNPFASLVPGASKTCTGSYAITQADIDAGNRHNTATANSNQAGPVTNSYDVPLYATPSISIEKTGVLDLGSDVLLNAGDLINYSLLIANTGNKTLTNVIISDPILGTITCPSGNPIPILAPGLSQTCTGSYVVTQADIDADNRHNTATANSDQIGPVADSYDVPLVASPSLTLDKTGALDLGNGLLEVGDLINYTLLVTNTGNKTLTNVIVSDPLLGVITCPGGNGTLSLAPEASVSCSGSYAVTQADIDAGNRDNTATADSDQAGPVTDSYDVVLRASPSISLEKTGVLDLGNGSLDVLDLIYYTLVVSNTGNATLTNVTVVDPLLGTVTCSGGNGTLTLEPGAKDTCTGTYAITQVDIDAGHRENTATADSDQAGPVTDTYDVPLNASPGLSLVKTGELVLGNGLLDVGDLINYNLVVTNIGNKTLINVTISDPLLGTITCPGGNPIPILVPGASVTCTGSYAINQADIDAGHRDNTATAASGTLIATDDYDVLLTGAQLIPVNVNRTCTTFSLVNNNPIGISGSWSIEGASLSGNFNLSAQGSETIVTGYFKGDLIVTHDNFNFRIGVPSNCNGSFILIPVTGINLGTANGSTSARGLFFSSLVFFGLGLVLKGFGRKKMNEE